MGCLPFILAVLVCTTDNKLLLHPGPTGITLCHRVCFTTCNCQTFTYLSEQLACYLGNLTIIRGEDRLVSNLKNNNFGNYSMHNCPTGSRIFLNRKRNLVCLRVNKNDSLESGNKVRVRVLPKGYKLFKGSKNALKHYRLETTFASAKNHCIQDGGSLAQFHKGFDRNLLKQLYETEDKYDFTWINLRYDRKSGQFLWGDRELFQEVDLWAPNEPSSGTFPFWEEDCVGFSYRREFRDISCFNKEKFLCEFDV